MRRDRLSGRPAVSRGASFVRQSNRGLLLDDWRHAGVEEAFLNRTVGTTPEAEWLVRVLGMAAEMAGICRGAGLASPVFRLLAYWLGSPSSVATRRARVKSKI